MGQQLKARIKRKRRTNYLARKKERTLTAKLTAPKHRPSDDKAAKPALKKKAPAKKAAPKAKAAVAVVEEVSAQSVPDPVVEFAPIETASVTAPGQA